MENHKFVAETRVRVIQNRCVPFVVVVVVAARTQTGSSGREV